MKNDIAQRKLDHLNTVLHRDVSNKVGTGFEHIRFEHNALPEIDFDRIDVSTEFMGRSLRAPLLVSSMTGGPEKARLINEAIAAMAQELKIAFAVGSQRIALQSPQSAGFDKALRRLAPDVPILANIGAAQLLESNPVDTARRAVEMIEADALIVHLNPLQEVLQQGGDRRWHGVLKNIELLVLELSCPLIIKEVGCGISADVARRLASVGVASIDIAGMGGTSWAAVEADRAESAQERQIAECFRDWGIPTSQSLINVHAACPKMNLIASGGMKTGLDVAKAIRLGANMAGFAASILPATLAGTEALISRFQGIITELKIAAFCTGSASLKALTKACLLERSIPESKTGIIS